MVNLRKQLVANGLFDVLKFNALVIQYIVMTSGRMEAKKKRVEVAHERLL